MQRIVGPVLLFFCLLLPHMAAAQSDEGAVDNSTYSRAELADEVQGFFEDTSQGLAEIIEKVFSDLGRPNGYIKGGEGGGALVVGLRYGEGTLHLKSGATRKVYWQGPSVGFDIGGNASKVFTLVYNLKDPDDIYQRFPGVDGSAYVVGGFSVNYQKSLETVLAPIRSGVGLRLGANVGYLHYTRNKSINPF
ncbi:MAG: DUF1134 domain-containing protein [Desulfohalobiaceae bacterium]